MVVIICILQARGYWPSPPRRRKGCSIPPCVRRIENDLGGMYVPGRVFLGEGRYSGRYDVASIDIMSGSFLLTSEAETIDVAMSYRCICVYTCTCVRDC